MLAIQQQPVERGHAMLMFKDAVSAIQWAEEYASRPDVGSQIGKLLKKPGDGEPVWDVALTISARLAQVQPPMAALAMKCLYAGVEPTRDLQLAEAIGEVLVRSEAANGRPKGQMYQLGLAVIKAERAQSLYGDRYPLRRMAHQVGVSHVQFMKGLQWLELRRCAVETLRAWLDRADREMRLWLEGQGWLEIHEDA